MSQILFKESSGGYGYRTYKNASADVTLAFAMDFSTAGERLTARAASGMGKLYVPICIDLWGHDPSQMYRDTLSAAKGILGLGLDSVTINVAGNGIYTLAKHCISQDDIDSMISIFIGGLNYELMAMGIKIKSIQSGGQTGVDEAGIKAAVKIGIQAIIIAPKGWMFRNAAGRDTCDEILFKKRFGPSCCLD